MSQNETLDFSNVAPAEGGQSKYLRPGVYFVKPIDVELSEREGGTSAIKITFEAVNDPYDGQIVDEKFFLSQKALPRLQYLHERYFGTRLENKAITFQKLVDYFRQKMLAKPKTFPIVVGGEENEGKVYGRLPYSDFILDADGAIDVEEGAYEEGSEQYKKVVRKRNSSRGAAPVLSQSVSNAAVDDLPWMNKD